MWEYPIPQATNPSFHPEVERHCESVVWHSNTQIPRPWLEQQTSWTCISAGVSSFYIAYVQGAAGAISKSGGDAGHFE